MLRKNFEHALSSLIMIGSLWMVKVKDNNKKNNGGEGKGSEGGSEGEVHERSWGRGDILKKGKHNFHYL